MSSAEVTAEVKVAVVTALLSMPSGAVMDQSKSKLFSNLITRVGIVTCFIDFFLLI